MDPNGLYMYGDVKDWSTELLDKPLHVEKIVRKNGFVKINCDNLQTYPNRYLLPDTDEVTGYGLIRLDASLQQTLRTTQVSSMFKLPRHAG